jgi:hypothetical protein
MLRRFSGFDWDEGNREKCCAHGVSIEEIEQAFRGGAEMILPDVKHSDVEDRFIAAGRTLAGRPLLVAFTYRTRGAEVLVRPISARFMHVKEARRYGQAHS